MNKSPRRIAALLFACLGALAASACEQVGLEALSPGDYRFQPVEEADPRVPPTTAMQFDLETLEGTSSLLSTRLNEDLQIVERRRVCNTSAIALPGLAAEKQVMALDLAGIAVSAGSACSSGKVTKSHVLSAMGWPDDLAGSSIRVSLGWATTEDDVARFLDAYERLAAKAEAA